MNTNIYIKNIKTDNAGYITDITLSEDTIDFAKLKLNSTKIGTDYYPDLSVTENDTYDEGPYGTVTVNVEGGGSTTLYCWKYDALGLYYYTTSEEPSANDAIYDYVNYIDGSGNKTYTMLKSNKTVTTVGTDSITSTYTLDSGGITTETPVTLDRYSDGDVEL